MSRWNQTTRGLRYDAAKVAERCRARAAELRAAGDELHARAWEATAEDAESGRDVRSAAWALLRTLEEGDPT